MNQESSKQDGYDVVVVGGGAAGLSGALTLARARRSVLVIDAAQPRNAPAGHVHGYLGHEGRPPAELLTVGRDEVTAYGGRIVNGEVVSAHALPGRDQEAGGFDVVLRDGTRHRARRLLVTTGLEDELPQLPGLAERWGRDVLHCPYCHGWEVRDGAVGVLGTSPFMAHQALLWRQWSERVTLFQHTAPEPTEEEREQLAARGVTVVTGRVESLQITGDRLTGVRLADGRTVPCEALVVSPNMTVRREMLASLGLRTTEHLMNGHFMGHYFATDPTGATEVPGVWAAGNVADLTATVIGAAAAGMRAAVAINGDLISEDTRLAVAARRVPFSAAAEREVADRVLGDRRHGL
ncbi:Thioredoxin reductase [Thermomonospora echinospora]|uniref:Thioredoxin reductase n=1 Tax=Thermomonospora echinospora TaxID=1992 RepID=A0A1H6CDH3_9ACTN|nr:NAD(P)/FAD-dependent oxidoreductase [Thermomonospora echinospora]SEG71004.1 Thioredoxin reductase [Thermomonospora echinospora]